MKVTRRRTVRTIGASVALPTLAGCVSNGDSDTGDEDDNRSPTDERPPSDDLPQVDEPPCEESGGRDPLWLCENMASEPSLAFEQAETTARVLADEGLRVDAEREGAQFYAALLTDADHLDRIDGNSDGSAVDLLASTEFDSQAAVVVQTGWGSGSVTPHLERIEETGDGIHAFGCYRRPCGGTDDYTLRTVVAQFDRPETLDAGRVSLTVNPETRVTFEAGAVVTIEDEL